MRLAQRIGCALALCAALSCGDDGDRTAPQPAPTQQPQAAPTQPSAAEAPEPAPAPAPSRSLEFRAPAGPEALATALGPPIPGVGRRLHNDAKQPLVLDFTGGARVTLEPGAELWVLELAPSLLSVSGRILVERLPEAARPDQPSLRIATLGGALGVTGAATLRLQTAVARGAAKAPPRALTQLILLQGSVTWQHETPERALTHERLLYGERLPELAPLQLFAAKSAADADKRAAQALRSARAWGPPGDPEAHLEALLSELAALRDQGQGLLAPANLRRARAAVPDAGLKSQALPGDARAYQKQLVQHAQRKLVLKQQLLLAVEQSLLTRLLACAASPAGARECPGLEAWSARFTERLRAAL
jgi:hypothetical protein